MMCRRKTWVVLGFVAMLALTLPAAQEQETEEERGSNEPAPWAKEPPIDRPPSYYASGNPPLPVEKVYDKSKRKVWSAVTKVLEREDLPLEVEDREKGHLKTKLIDFQRRWGNVATKPPGTIMERGGILQHHGLNSGRFSVDIRILETHEGTLVSIRPYIEEYARHLLQQRRIWVERYSNGKIEKYFIEKFDEILE